MGAMGAVGFIRPIGLHGKWIHPTDTTMANSEKLTDGVRAVDRALEILLAFTPTDFELSAAELLKRVNLSRPTLYRLLYTLEQNGFITSVGEPQKFRLGPSVAHLAHVWTSSLDIGAVAQPIMRDIWEKTGETVALFIPQGAYRTCIAELPSAQPLSFKRGVGYRERIARGASGRAILAYTATPQELLHEYIANQAIDEAKFVKELEATRKRGYAMSKDELIEGAAAVAVPFFRKDNEAAGSIGVFGPSVRLESKKIPGIVELLQAGARDLSKALGYL